MSTDHLFAVAVVGWFSAVMLSGFLWIVSRELGKAARDNKQLRDRLQVAEQGERFWRLAAGAGGKQVGRSKIDLTTGEIVD